MAFVRCSGGGTELEQFTHTYGFGGFVYGSTSQALNVAGGVSIPCKGYRTLIVNSISAGGSSSHAEYNLVSTGTYDVSNVDSFSVGSVRDNTGWNSLGYAACYLNANVTLIP